MCLLTKDHFAENSLPLQGKRMSALLTGKGLHFFLALFASGESRHGELTSAVELVVEAILAEELVAALLQAAFAPIAIPELYAFHLRGSTAAGLIDLLKRFPSGRRKRSSEARKAQFFRFKGRTEQAQTEALQASCAPLRFVLASATHPTEPIVVALLPAAQIVVVIDNHEAKLLRIAGDLILTNEVFLLGVDIRIAIVDYRTDVVLRHPFEDSRRTRGAAAMQ